MIADRIRYWACITMHDDETLSWELFDGRTRMGRGWAINDGYAVEQMEAAATKAGCEYQWIVTFGREGNHMEYVLADLQREELVAGRTFFITDYTDGTVSLTVDGVPV